MKEAPPKWTLFFRVARVVGLALFVVGFSEVLIALDRAHRDSASAGFLVKSGQEYLVAWRTRNDSGYRAFRFETLEAARHHLLSLDLEPGGAFGEPGNQIERLWIREKGQERGIFWKIRRIPFTHRLTFRKEQDAKFFFSAFEKGFYRPSPFGHAIFYTPIVKAP